MDCVTSPYLCCYHGYPASLQFADWLKHNTRDLLRHIDVAHVPEWWNCIFMILYIWLNMFTYSYSTYSGLQPLVLLLFSLQLFVTYNKYFIRTIFLMPFLINWEITSHACVHHLSTVSPHIKYSKVQLISRVTALVIVILIESEGCFPDGDEPSCWFAMLELVLISAASLCRCFYFMTSSLTFDPLLPPLFIPS